MADIVRFFYPPRILIVEDTSLGRVALIGILRCYKLNVLIDIAACGYEAIQKYKFFLRKGYIIYYKLKVHLRYYFYGL